MKKLVISLALALLLVAAVAIPAMAAPVEQNVSASVSIGEVISATITDNTPTGLDFGSPVKGASNQPEAAQDADNGAITVVVASETNVNCDIDVKALDFTATGATLEITNAKYGTTNDAGSAAAFAVADEYYNLGAHTVGSSATTVEIYHWLSIPNDQVAGEYSSTFTYRVDKSS